MQVRMLRDWWWKGGMLRDGEMYQMNSVEAKTLVTEGLAEEVKVPEMAAVASSERAVKKRPAARKSHATTGPKRKKNG